MFTDEKFFSVVSSLKEKKVSAALCTVVKTQGSTPQKAGAKMIVLLQEEKPTIIGTIGGGTFEYELINEAIKAIGRGLPTLVTKALGHDLGMCCGGEMTVFIEPIEQKSTLLLFGAGHIGKIIGRLAYDADFDVVVVDERKEFLSHPDFATAVQKINDIPQFASREIIVDCNTFIVVVTHDHKRDQDAIEAVIEKPFGYLGLVGSVRKALMTKKRLQIKNVSEHLISRIVCPAGLNISANTPFEIAVSIVSQMIQIRNERRQQRSKSEPITKNNLISSCGIIKSHFY